MLYSTVEKGKQKLKKLLKAPNYHNVHASVLCENLRSSSGPIQMELNYVFCLFGYLG